MPKAFCFLKSLKKSFLLFFSGLLFFLALNTAQAAFLKADQAFRLSLKKTAPNKVILIWNIAPTYHLFSDRIFIKSENNDVHIEWQLPKNGVVGSDSTHPSSYLMYYHRLEIPIVLKTNIPFSQIKLQVSYQGCADAGLCYPPQKKIISLSNSAPETKLALSHLINNAEKLSTIHLLFQEKSVFIILVSFFGFGILFAFTPCVFPMLPILSSIIMGEGEKITSQRAFIYSSIYILSSATTYAIAGMIAGLAGHHLQSLLQNPWTIGLSGLIFIALGLSLLNIYELSLPIKLLNKLMHLNQKTNTRSLTGILMMGVLSTLMLSPCVTGPLVGALTYLSEAGNPWLGGSALFVMGLGMGLPLLIIGTSVGKFLPKAGKWMENIKRFFAVLLFSMAIWFWARIFSATFILISSGLLLFACSIYLSFFIMTMSKIKKRIYRLIGLFLALYGICLFIAAATNNTNFLAPWNQLIQHSNSDDTKSQSAIFSRIQNLSELNILLKNSSQATLIDFTANWCEACQSIKKDIFSNPTVLEGLRQHHIRLLEVDLTVITSDKQEILEKYHVIAPPTLLFFDEKGKYLENKTLIGKASVSQIIEELNTL